MLDLPIYIQLCSLIPDALYRDLQEVVGAPIVCVFVLC